MQTDFDEKLIKAIANAVGEAVRIHSMPKLLVSIEEAAAMLSVSPRTVEGLIEEGQLRSKLVRRKIRVSMKSLQGYADRS